MADEIIRLVNVTKSYDETPVLKNINLYVNAVNF